MTYKKPLYTPFILIALFVFLALASCANISGDGNEDGFMVSARIPKRSLSQGERFTLELTLENTGLFNQEIESIALPADFVKGFDMPNLQVAMAHTVNSNGDWVFDYARTIAPQGTETVSFYFTTAKTGRFNGAGEVKTTDGSFRFDLDLLVIGVNPVDWSPGVAKPAPDGPVNEPAYLSVVRIDAYADVDGERSPVWHGSGTIVTPDGLILTSSDVVLSDRYFQVTDLIVSLTVDDKSLPVPTYRAGIVQANHTLGLALIKPRSTLDNTPIDYALLDLPAIPLGDSQLLEQGSELRALGYPNSPDSPDILHENLLRLNDFGSEFPFGESSLWHAEKAIPAGYIGGPILNEAGELVAVPVHKSPVTFDPNTIECQAFVDANRDGRIDELDPCSPIQLPVDTLRPSAFARQIVEAARRGEVDISAGNIERTLTHLPVEFVGMDDFSDNRNQWRVSENDLGEQKLEDGAYVFKLHKPMTRLWSPVNYGYGAMQIDVEAELLDPVHHGEFGLLCGVSETERTVFAVSENGFFAIWQAQGDSTRYLQPWQYAALDTGKPLTLSARCGSGWYEFVVNHHLLASGTDPEFVPGLTGLYAASYDEGGMVVSFDNFSVSIIE